VANLLNIFNPEVVVLAGGVTQAGMRSSSRCAPRCGAARSSRRWMPAASCPACCRDAGVVGAVATFAQRTRPDVSTSSTGAPATGRRKRLGVIGTFVWDIIHGRDVRDAAVRSGGASRTRWRRDAALPSDWELVPLVKVGSDLAPQAREFLRTLRRIAPDAAPIEVPHRNNRVELRYHSDERRSEVLSGGVPGWTWAGLQPLLRDLDALYINLISGFELDLTTAQLIRQHFKGPIYCDLHSLVLAVEPSGLRTPAPAAEVGGLVRLLRRAAGERGRGGDAGERPAGARGDRAERRGPDPLRDPRQAWGRLFRGFADWRPRPGRPADGADPGLAGDAGGGRSGRSDGMRGRVGRDMVLSLCRG
jgi:hypothetical protein